MYTANTPVMSTERAAQLGRFLGAYAIRLDGLTVTHIMQDGRRYVDRPTADVVTSTAGSAALSLPMAGGMAAVGVVVAPWLSLAALAALPALLRAQLAIRKREPAGGTRGGWPVGSELSFALADVSARRRKWAEYLLCLYALRNGWQLAGLAHPDQAAAAERYAAQHAGYPTPWGERSAGDRPGQVAATGRKPGGNPGANRAPGGRQAGGLLRAVLRDLL